MGDSLFFSSLRSFLNNHPFESVSSTSLRDDLSNISGINLTPFFDNWIFAPGFTHFSIDSTHMIPNGSQVDVNVFLRQRKHHTPDYYQHVPLEIAFYDQYMQPWIYYLDFSGPCMQFNVTLSFSPLMILIDPYAKISDAITEQQKMIYTTSNSVFDQAKCRLSVKLIVSPGDSTLFHSSHHWVAPDRFKNPSNFPGYVLCDSRYWTIDGINLANLKGTLQFAYDAGANNAYLDSAWIKNSEDSIRLFYRQNASEDWQFANDSLRAGGLNDKVGSVYAKDIKKGEYTFGIKRSTYTDTIQDVMPGPCAIVTDEVNHLEELNTSLVYPNPFSDGIVIEQASIGIQGLELFDAAGRLILTRSYFNSPSQVKLDLSQLPEGIFFLACRTGSGKSNRLKLIKIR
jgi:aminopeptidase N